MGHLVDLKKLLSNLSLRIGAVMLNDDVVWMDVIIPRAFDSDSTTVGCWNRIKKALEKSQNTTTNEPSAAIELLRQLFYMRLTTGVKLEEIIMEHQPDMWRDIHGMLTEEE